MTNLRAQIESDLAQTLEGDYGVPVILISPTGIRIDKNLHTEEPLVGQVLYESITVNPDTGEEIIVNNPLVTLRRSSLAQVPAPGETWHVKIPVDPAEGSAIMDFTADSTHAPGGSRSIGFITLYLRRVVHALELI